MINEELRTFISKMRAAGKTDPEIAAELKTAGWGEVDIASALNFQPILPTNDQSPVRPDLQEEKNNVVMVGIIIMIVAIMAGVVGWLFVKKSHQQSVTQPTLTPPASQFSQPLPEQQSANQQQKINTAGTNFSSAIVVTADSENKGVAWEYDWLKKNACSDNNGYKKPAGQVLKSNNNHRYDVITAVCNDGKNIDYYFLIDNFFGK